LVAGTAVMMHFSFLGSVDSQSRTAEFAVNMSVPGTKWRSTKKINPTNNPPQKAFRLSSLIAHDPPALALRRGLLQPHDGTPHAETRHH
jgi:hypothetical protein